MPSMLLLLSADMCEVASSNVECFFSLETILKMQTTIGDHVLRRQWSVIISMQTIVGDHILYRQWSVIHFYADYSR